MPSRKAQRRERDARQIQQLPDGRTFVDVDALERDIEKNKATLRSSIKVIDQSLLEAPECVEILIRKQDRAGLKKYLAISGTANQDAERYEGEISKLENKFENLKARRPQDPSMLTDHYMEGFEVGLEFISLNERIMQTGVALISDVTDILEAEPAAKPEEVKP